MVNDDETIEFNLLIFVWLLHFLTAQYLNIDLCFVDIES